MNMISEILGRVKLGSISSFLLDGVNLLRPEEYPYEERLSKAKEPFIEKLNESYQTNKSYHEMEALLNYMLGTYEDVYFEIGMKVGAILQRQLIE